MRQSLPPPRSFSRGWRACRAWIWSQSNILGKTDAQRRVVSYGAQPFDGVRSYFTTIYGHS